MLSTNGNIQLNFQDLPVIDEGTLACLFNCTPRNIHFKKTNNSREGTGLVVGSGDDGSQWTIDMSQFAGLNVGAGGLAYKLWLRCCELLSPCFQTIDNATHDRG